MKSFKEAAGADLAEKSELCQCMESVIGKCKKTVDKRGKKVSMDELKSYTREFIVKAFEVQIMIPQKTLNTEENIRKYNDALWEDIEVIVMRRQIAKYNMPTSSAEREKYVTNIGDMKEEIEKENQRKKASNSIRSKKQLAFRYWVGDKGQDSAAISGGREKLSKEAVGWALYPYYAFIWEDGYIPNEIGIEYVNCFKVAYILSMFLGESGNTRGHCMFQAFISQVNHNYRRFTEKNRSERRQSGKQIEARREEAIEEWLAKFEQSSKELWNETDSKIAEMKTDRERLSLETGVGEIGELYLDFSHNRIGDMLKELEMIFGLEDGQKQIDDSGKWLLQNGNRMETEIMPCVHHIWNCIKILSDNSSDTWKRQNVFSPDLEYLKGIVKYASECRITYSKALLVKCLDDLTDWVLYKQYLKSRESEEMGTNRTAVRVGRTDFIMYSGLALRQASIETIDNGCVTENQLDADRLNRDFWHYAQILKDEIIDMLPVRKLDSDKAFSPNETFKRKLEAGFKYHDRIYSNILEGDNQEFGDKGSLCAFFENVYEKRITEKYYEKNL